MHHLDVGHHGRGFGVCPVGYHVVYPPCRSGRVGVEVAVAFAEALGYLGDAAIHWYIEVCGCVVHTKPEDSASLGTLVTAHLSHKRPCRLLRSRRTLVPVLHGVQFECQSAVAQLAVPRTGVGALRDVKRRTLVLVAHALLHLLHAHLVIRLDIQRHTCACVLAAGLEERLARREIKVPVHVVREVAEERPHACLAHEQPREIVGVICLLEVEVLVFALEIAHLARELHHIFAPHPVGFVFEVDGCDACLVGMCGNAVVRNARCHPYGTFLARTFANQIHNPNLIGVAYGERLAARRIAVFSHQRRHARNRLTGSLATLQRDVNQASVVDAHSVLQLCATAPCGLADGQLMLIHIAHHRIGVAHLRDTAQRASRVPVAHLAHRTLGVICRGAEMEKSVQRVTVGCIRNHRAAVHRSVLADQKVGAGHACHPGTA